jgi:hypothetical protein
MSCTRAVHVPIPLIKPLSEGHAARRIGTTAGRVAPDSHGLVHNRRAVRIANACALAEPCLESVS